MNTFGTVKLVNGFWVITAEPHVRARLKRVFARAPQEAGTTIKLSASMENTRELEWFLTRYPMEVEGRDFMSELANRHRASEEQVVNLLAGHVPPMNLAMAHPPRDYQAIVPQYVRVKGGLLLADDLGLGKTVSSICTMLMDGALPAVVVAPPHLLRQWRDEIAKFAPALRTHIVKQGKVYDLAPKKRGQPKQVVAAGSAPALPDVLITSYHMLRGWADQLAGRVKTVVFDECQQLRRDGTQIYAAAKLVASGAEYRLGNSATPIYGYGGEFFQVIDVLVPDALGTKDEFHRDCCATDGSGNYRLKNPDEFGAYLRRSGLMLRRTRQEVGRELPPLTKVIHEIDADQSVIDQMQTDAVNLAKIIVRNNQRFKGEKMQAAGEFDALMRQATGVAKAPYVAEFVRMLLESGEPIVLFGWHRAVYEIWMESLKEFNPVLYTGSESPTQKEAAKQAFLSGETKLMIISLRSGAGLDGLQDVCRVGVFGEIDWAPGVHEQCMGRFDRDGQDMPTTAYFLLSSVGADPVIADVLGIKRDQIEGVRNPDMALAERIDTGENNIQRLAREYLRRHGVSEDIESPGQTEADQPILAT